MFRQSFSRYPARNRSWRSRNSRHAMPAPSSRYIKKAEDQAPIEAYAAQHQFSDFALDEHIKSNIASHGYITPTPIQDQTIPLILAGRDVVGIANTGTGKTAAFLVPFINKVLADRSQKALIVTPTRELAAQIEEELNAFAKGLGINCILCIGGASMNRQISSLRQNYNLVIGTPGRLKDLARRRLLPLENSRTIILDEVDRMLDIGFIHDIKYLISLLPKNRQSLFFSATISREVNEIMESFLINPEIISVKTAEAAQTIEQDIIRVRNNEEKINKLRDLLHQEEFKKVLVFGKTKWNVERLARTLYSDGFSVAALHGNKSQNQRVSALHQFKANRIQVLVATDIAARGLDIEDVSHVINFDEPASYTDYVHRIGRTGRANKSGKALTFVF